jgi:Transglycosylase SLT domain
VIAGLASTPHRANGEALPAALGAAVLVVMAIGLTAVVTLLGSGSLTGDVQQADLQEPSASQLALTEIPPEYMRLYKLAAQRYGLDWTILAGIGRVECDHGRDPDPACTREGAVNSAGAGGPMQFIASTWARYGVDGNGDGRIDRWNPADAIYSAANYLRARGAPGDYRAAILAYNHVGWYVTEVESWAARYRGAEQAASPVAGEGADAQLARETTTPVRFIPGRQATLAPEDGHVALIPAGVPATVQAMLIAGNELQELPYGPDGHPDPLGAPDEDCSSSVNYVLYRAGVRPLPEILAQNPLAQDYVNWGAPGPGRWVSIYAADSPTPHVFIVIAGLRLDTSHDGTDVGPNHDQDGPRWRILDQIPTWAHWSVRHPPGL